MNWNSFERMNNERSFMRCYWTMDNVKKPSNNTHNARQNVFTVYDKNINTSVSSMGFIPLRYRVRGSH